ncbi:hypothetical protein [Hymenobacter koreensis]|uniref:Uncharacterized protein n=1 Tax=Hymenobacter koreensis TaxID=1084523 RepID=A0ABP8JA47_9BACT
MKAYLRLRARVLGRQLAELGWVRLALLGPLFIAAVGNTLFTVARWPQGHWALPALLLVFTFSAHRRRTDLLGLAIIAPQHRIWLMAEYALLALPAFLILLLFEHWPAALLTLFSTPCVAWASPAVARASRSRPRSFFRSEAFEWVGGFRQLGAWWMWLLILGVALALRAYPTATAASLVVWTVIAAPIYSTPEPTAMLLVAAKQPGAYLARRLVLGLVYYLLTTAPLLFLLLVGPAGPAGAALLLLWGTAVWTMVVLAKYSFYPNATLIRLTQGGMVALGLLLLASNPVYGALFAAAFGGVIFKSRRQLWQYRYD